MAAMDIFEGDAFSIIELTRALDNIPFKPATLSGSGLFADRGIRSGTVVVESRDGTLSLIPSSERGSAYEQQVPERRDVRAFVCRQFKKQDVIWASEIQGIRAFGSDSETQQVQGEVARRLRRLRSDAEATFEYHLLNAIQGLVKDPKDGSTVVNYFTEFAITPSAEVDFDLDNATPAAGALHKKCQSLIESVEDGLGGLATGSVMLRAECGSSFFADLVAHKEVRETDLNTAAAADLRSRVADEVSFEGITFRRYRGNAAFGVPADRRTSIPRASRGCSRSITPRPTRSRPSIRWACRSTLAPSPTEIVTSGCGSRSRATRCRSARGRRRSGPASAPDERARRRVRRVVFRLERHAGRGLHAGGRRARHGAHRAPPRRRDQRVRRGAEVVGDGPPRRPVVEVAEPRPGDGFEIDGEAFVVQGEPVGDRERLVWTVELQLA